MENTDLFSAPNSNSPLTPEARTAAPLGQLPLGEGLHVEVPDCDCHQAAECPHETTIECELCGKTYTAGTNHCCNDGAGAGVEAHPEGKHTLVRAELLTAAACAVTEYFRDEMDPAALHLCMTCLQRELRGGGH